MSRDHSPANTAWMGRYRALVQALVQHANIGLRVSAIKTEIMPGVFSTAQEWQVLEYIVEHEDHEENMRFISDKLGIAKSSLSKYTKHLCQIGFVERYRTANNRKNIVLRASQKGKAYYERTVEKIMRPVFDPFFERMGSIPDPYLEAFAAAIEHFNLARMTPPEAQTLIPIDGQAETPAP